jgi:DNA-binding MarR family transcriptional regulator
MNQPQYPTPVSSPATDTSEQPPMQVGRLIRLVFNSLVHSIDTRMQPLELTAMQWEPMLLLALGRADTVAGLARECDVDCGAMTRMLDRLEQKQLLRRLRSDADRRVVNLELTDKGRAVALEIPLLVREELQRSLREITPQEQETLVRLLTQMLANATPVQDA